MKWIALMLLITAVMVFVATRPQERELANRPVREAYEQSAEHVAPADTVVYESDPALAKKLIESGNGYRLLDTNGAAFLVPECWHSFRGAYFCPDGTLFLHERTSANGLKRLVAVDMQIHPDDSLTINSTSVSPAGEDGWADWEHARKSNHGPSNIKPITGQSVRYFAGQIDRNDQSHFTIRFQTGNVEGFIDGWLRDDGDVELKNRE